MELKELKIGELIARIPVIQGGMGVGVSLHKLAGAGLPVSLPDMVVVEGPKAGGHLGFSMEQLTGKEPLDFDAEIRIKDRDMGQERLVKI